MNSIHKKISQVDEAGGVLLVDKPKGITSFDVIRALRKKLGVRKIGHAGTLDPLASGLLLVGVQEGTKRLKELIGLPKEYEAEIIFGIGTDTGDMDGEVVARKSVRGLSREKVAEILLEMKGTLNLPVPVYSAVKRGGEPLYKKARRGEKVVPPVKPMRIDSIELLNFSVEEDEVSVRVRLKVQSGVYVRSVAEEIGRRLLVPAAVKELRRTRIGDFRVENAETL